MLTTAPRGTQDILPGQVEKFHHVEDTFRRICRLHSFQEIRTPMFEHTELFKRAVGEETDIVQKETYTFNDRSDRSLTLRAEGTAPAVRAFVEHGIHAQAQPTKYYYIAQIFRYENPQKGRLRQHQQCGIELFGTQSPQADVEVIGVADMLYRTLGLTDFSLHINSVGCPECRAEHRKALAAFLQERIGKLCSDCQNRYERNPMRILDCKHEACQREVKGAPTTGDWLCSPCRDHYQEVKEGLNALQVPFIEEPRLVRGLDYYTHTAFEFNSNLIGAQSAIGGGGRYDGLVDEVGGPPTPGIGFGIGTERLIMALEAEGVAFPEVPGPEIFLATLGEQANKSALKITSDLRRAGIVAEKDLLGRSLKAQMKAAGRLKARFVAVLGDDELARGVVALRDMQSGEQQEVAISDLATRLRSS